MLEKLDILKLYEKDEKMEEQEKWKWKMLEASILKLILYLLTYFSLFLFN
jgi:hypothetical protein